jgi:hypothetical protein
MRMAAITLRTGLLLAALVLLTLQAIAVIECLTYSPPVGFVPDDEDQYVRDGLAGLPALALYGGASWFALIGVRDRTRPVWWTILVLVAGLVATFLWLVSLLGALA